MRKRWSHDVYRPGEPRAIILHHRRNQSNHTTPRRTYSCHIYIPGEVTATRLHARKRHTHIAAKENPKPSYHHLGESSLLNCRAGNPGPTY